MRFVLATLGTLGDLYPFLALGRALSARGHSVVIAAARALHEHVEDAQLEAFPSRPNMSPDDVRAGFAHFDHWPRDESTNAQVDLSDFIRDRVTDLLDACRGADALIHNSGVTGESVAAEILGIDGIRVVIAAERQWNRGYRDFLSELETVPGNAGGSLAQNFFEWNEQCRKRAGLKEDTPANGWHGYFAGAPLVAASRHFLAPITTSSWDATNNATLCGFWFHESPRWRAWKPDAQLCAFMARRPMVLSLSSQPVAEPERVVELHVETARRLGRPILIQAGWAGLKGSDGGDVLFRDFLPPDWTFSQAACVINHGGAGTIARALRNACPLLIEPWGNDQFFNAWMVVKGGLGAAMNPKKATPAELARIIDQKVLSSDVIRRVRGIAQRLAAEDGTALAVAAIENRMENRPVSGGVDG